MLRPVEILLIVFILGAFLVFFGLLTVGILFLARASGRRMGRQRDAAVAALGLRAEGRRGLVGERDGVPVRVRHATEGSGDNRRSYTYVEAELDPPLRLGLNLRAQRWLGARFSELFGSDVKLGDPRLDEAFHINAVEQEELPRFLAFPEFRETLMQAWASNSRFWITDDVVHVSFSGHTYAPERLESPLAWVVAMAKNAREARRRMGPTAREQAVIASWGGLAGSLGWTFDTERLSLDGSRGRLRFHVVPLLQRKGWSTRFRIDFPRPLGASLSLTREGSLTPVARWFGMQDIEVGDPRFDSTFVVKGEDKNAVRHLLGDAAIRDGLVTLMGAAKSLRVADDHIDAVAQGLVEDAARLQSSLDSVADLADRLVVRVSAPSQGAYR